jgi:hypothetical protein
MKLSILIAAIFFIKSILPRFLGKRGGEIETECGFIKLKSDFTGVKYFII